MPNPIPRTMGAEVWRPQASEHYGVRARRENYRAEEFESPNRYTYKNSPSFRDHGESQHPKYSPSGGANRGRVNNDSRGRGGRDPFDDSRSHMDLAQKKERSSSKENEEKETSSGIFSYLRTSYLSTWSDFDFLLNKFTGVVLWEGGVGGGFEPPTPSSQRSTTPPASGAGIRCVGSRVDGGPVLMLYWRGLSIHHAEEDGILCRVRLRCELHWRRE